VSRKPIPPQARFSVLSRDRFTCRYCSRSAPDVELQIDHVKAVANGGTNDLDNLVTACVDCNQGKSASDVPFVPAAPNGGKSSARRHPLVGFGVLSFVNGKVCEQGLIVTVIEEPEGSLAVIQFFEWMGGGDTYARLIPVRDLVFHEKGQGGAKSWRLFATNEARNDYYEWKGGKFEEGAR
jgi:Restriction endonuclease